MNITQKSLLSIGSGVVLACGLTVILVLATVPLSSGSSFAQKNLPYFILIFSLLVVAPVTARRLNHLSGLKKILGWTFIGTGAEFLVLPISFLFVVESISSHAGILVTATLFLLSFVIGMLAGLTSIVLGITLIKDNRGKNGRR